MQATKGIPTEYRSYRFRSRLEARWARFFDLLGWRWEYEPVDFNGWIPDFAIYGDCGNIVYVEVKPVIQFPKDVADKIDASGCQDDVLIVGQTLWTDPETSFGWLRSWDEPWLCGEWVWASADFGCWNQGQIGFAHNEGSWDDKISGRWEAWNGGKGIWNHHGSGIDLDHLWALAANQTQWTPSS